MINPSLTIHVEDFNTQIEDYLVLHTATTSASYDESELQEGDIFTGITKITWSPQTGNMAKHRWRRKLLWRRIRNELLIYPGNVSPYQFTNALECPVSFADAITRDTSSKRNST